MVIICLEVRWGDCAIILLDTKELPPGSCLHAMVFSAKNLKPHLVPILLLPVLVTSLSGCFLGNWFGSDLPAIAYGVWDGGDGQIWVQEPQGDDPVRISPRNADANFPRWSPGQRYLAWISRGATAELMLYDTETGETDTVVSGVAETQPPVWAPGSDRIAYVSGADGNPDIYMVELSDGQKTRLTFSPARERIGDWSPDGEWLVFTESGHDGLLLRNPNGVNRIELTDGPDSDPAWSPKGDRIAFLRQSDDGRDVYVLRPTNSKDWTDDTDAVAVSNAEHDESAPAWSASGRRLAFVVHYDEQTEIFTVNVDGSKRERLTQNTADDLMPVWSETGDKIVFVSYAYGNAEILYMNGDGSEQMRLTVNDVMDAQPDW